MNILIVDDHLLFVEGMRCLLTSFEGEVDIHSADNTEVALKLITKEICPDLILLDIQLSGVDGHGLLKELKVLRIKIPILMISSLDVPVATGVALALGASGFISRLSNLEDLLSAIKIVLGGDVYMPCDDEQVRTEYAGITVTTRQQQILYLLSQGLLNKQIAHELSISANTVKAHLHQIFRTLNVSNRTAAVQHAYEKGLL